MLEIKCDSRNFIDKLFYAVTFNSHNIKRCRARTHTKRILYWKVDKLNYWFVGFFLFCFIFLFSPAKRRIFRRLMKWLSTLINWITKFWSRRRLSPMGKFMCVCAYLLVSVPLCYFCCCHRHRRCRSHRNRFRLIGIIWILFFLSQIPNFNVRYLSGARHHHVKQFTVWCQRFGNH